LYRSTIAAILQSMTATLGIQPPPTDGWNVGGFED
jgi:hypothetical protein